MTSRLVTLAIWLAAVAGALAWALPLLGRPTPVPAQAMVAAPAMPIAGGAERLLGTPPPAPVQAKPPAESRFKLLGVIAPRHVGAAGLALISVDGKPARALAVGREVDPGTRVLAISHRRVDLGAVAGAPTLTLELPALSEASRGRPGEAAAGAPPAVSPAAPPAVTQLPVAGRQRAVPMFGPGATTGRTPGVPAFQPPQPPQVPQPTSANDQSQAGEPAGGNNPEQRQ